MCPPPTPSRKNPTSAAPLTASDAHKLSDRVSKKHFHSGATKSNNDSRPKGNLKHVALTLPMMILILVTSSMLSFYLGNYFRYSRHLKNFILLSTSDGTVSTTGASIPSFDNVMEHAMPTPWTNSVQSDSGSSEIQYSFKNLVENQLANVVVSSNSALLKPDGAFLYVEHKRPANSNDTLSTKRDFVQDDSETYEPSGQHILVDIENVDSDFLRSEERLTTSMMELILNRTNMTLLSYHCHGTMHQQVMGGISCAGILLESHVAFHTFPIFGSISFDLFSCGKTSLLPTLTDIRELFAIVPPIASLTVDVENHSSDFSIMNNTQLQRHNRAPAQVIRTIVSEAKQPRVKWTYKRRGFPINYKVNSPVSKSVSVADELPDFHWMLSMGNLDKTHLATVQTDFQRIDIFDMKGFPTRPAEEIDRVIFLDGIIQSRFIGEHAYHEALVHPVMICHDSPKRIIIIGGGEGATLREVLRHKTVEEVIMVEIDELMVLTSQMYLPEWSTCENGISCFDDPRVTVHFTDAIAWFIHRFGENSTIYDDDDVFDVIIMDALDPNSELEFSDFLYKNRDLMLAFSRALGENGIFVAQVGEDENFDDLPSSFDPENPLTVFLNGLESFGFESIVEYSESHGRFTESWGFIVAMKNRESRSNWLRNEAEINLEVAQRITPTTPLVFFDGSTMMIYQFASRISQEIWCRDRLDGECSTGQGFDPFIETISHTAFNVQPSTVNKGGRGVFATEFVPKRHRHWHRGVREWDVSTKYNI